MTLLFNILLAVFCAGCLYLFFDGGSYHEQFTQFLPSEDLKVIYLVLFAISALYLVFVWIKFSVKLILKLALAVIMAGLFYYFVYLS